LLLLLLLRLLILLMLLMAAAVVVCRDNVAVRLSLRKQLAAQLEEARRPQTMHKQTAPLLTSHNTHNTPRRHSCALL
jgi:hypothetical protein